MKNRLNQAENIRRAVFFDRPDYIPVVFHINPSCWHHYPRLALQELIEKHPFLFGEHAGFTGSKEQEYQILERVGKPFTDGWGCVWETTRDGIVGCVTHHPLADWQTFETYQPPNPDVDSGKGPVNWHSIAAQIHTARHAGQLTQGSLRHGHTFQTLADIRGYENLLLDMVHNEPRLPKLIDMVTEFNQAIVTRYLNLGAAWMSYPEDLGMQTHPLISPKLFRQFIKPGYQQLMAPARRQNCIVHIHCDGMVRDLIEDLIEVGAHVLNLQDLVNGIDWLRENLTGRICLELDIDRQKITHHGTPAQIDALIREEVHKLGRKEGGLMLIYGLYPHIPLQNIAALMDALEKYAFYYSG